MQTPLRAYLWPSLTLGLGGWALTLWLVHNVPPWPWARWLFFGGLFAGTFGMAFLFFLLWQSWRESPYPAAIASRRAALTAWYVSTYFWLEQGSNIPRSLAFGLALAFIALETLFSRRDPASVGAPPTETIMAVSPTNHPTEREPNDDSARPA
jgi:hypothetical protein